MSNPVCLHCRRSTRALDLIPDREICTFCAVKLPADQYPPRCEKVSQDTFIDRLILTTTPTVPGREITESVGIVSAQVAIGLNLFKDLGQAFRDVAGGRSANLQNMLAASRKAAFDEIEQEARRLGADAVVGVDFDISEFSAGNGMVLVSVTGTAVRFVQIQPVEAAA